MHMYDAGARNGFVDRVRQMDFQNGRCVNRECIDDSMIIGSRLIQRSSIC